MKLEFKLLTLKDDSTWLKRLKDSYDKIKIPRNKFKNEFVIVGEDNIDEKEYYKVQQINENGMCTFADLNIAYTALTMPKEDFIWDGTTYAEFDIPKKNITLDTIEDIQRLNGDREEE